MLNCVLCFPDQCFWWSEKRLQTSAVSKSRKAKLKQSNNEENVPEPSPGAALRWLAATPRAQHAGKGPVFPATAEKGHGWMRAPGHNGQVPLLPLAKQQQRQDGCRWAGHREGLRQSPVTAGPFGLSARPSPQGGLGRFVSPVAEVHLLYWPRKFLRRDRKRDGESNEHPRKFPCEHNSLLWVRQTHSLGLEQCLSWEGSQS